MTDAPVFRTTEPVSEELRALQVKLAMPEGWTDTDEDDGLPEDQDDD